MKAKLHPEKFRLDQDAFGFLVDILMILLVAANLILILFDWVYQVNAMQHLLERQTPGFYHFYTEQVHANFVNIDLAFVAIYLTEFAISWLVAAFRHTYYRWFFYPFVHWYDLLGCIPVGSFRWLRVLRLVTLAYRLHRRGLVDFSDTAFGQTLAKYWDALTEEITDRVVIKVLEGVKREARNGGPMVRRIEKEVVAPRREELIEYLSARIAEIARRSHAQYREPLADYLVQVTDQTVRNTPAGRRLASLPVAGPRAVTLLGETVRDTATGLIDQLVDDLASPGGRDQLNELVDSLLSAGSGGRQQLDSLIHEVVLEVLDQVQAQVAIKHWKEERA